MMDFRIGQGFDAHKLVSGRKLILCGVKIPHELGLEGHSDADVALHAVTDAILGALALGDIGQWFPDNSADWKDADSAELLRLVWQDPRCQKYQVNNLDLVIIAQKPKILPYVEAMRQRLAALLNADLNRISVKGKTTEHLGFTGREEGIAALAAVSLCTSFSGKE